MNWKVRNILSRFTSAPERFGIARWVYVRGLGAIYLVAILSWWVQLDGLVGEEGIAPARPALDRMEAYFETEEDRFAGGERARFWKLPTLSWINSSDAFQHALCGAGVLLALAVIAGFFTGPLLLLLWMIYLSLVNSGGVFMSFQWDSLLLEAGFLGLLMAPWRIYLRRDNADVSLWVLFLQRWLLFRLMFFSGYVKLASGDPTWRSCKALNFHYETQPIPNWIAWYAHQLPEWIQVASCGVMFGIELVLPFLIFLGRRPRVVACGGFVFLNALIILTGNYTYFNYLTILLCVPLLDDTLWPRRMGGRMKPQETLSSPENAEAAPAGSEGWKRRCAMAFRAVAGGLVFLVSLPLVYRQLGGDPGRVPGLVKEVQSAVAPFRSVNGYGLFAVMTTRRPEIEVEGSLDGVEWRTYRFRWKTSDLKARPRFVAPHQPRLDWQMWFEALGAERSVFDFQGESWFGSFLLRLLGGSEPVLELLAEDPFPGENPRYLRARVYDYRFTDFRERRATGLWWTREYSHDYVPGVSLRK